MVLPRLAREFSYAISTCFIGDKMALSVIAVVEADESSEWWPAEKAWDIDSENGVLVKRNSENIRCENELYGLP